MGESILAIHSVGNRIFTQGKGGELNVWVPSETDYSLEKTYAFNGGFCRSIIIDDTIVLPQDKGKFITHK